MLSKIYENLSNELISQRKLLGVSQQELATLVGTYALPTSPRSKTLNDFSGEGNKENRSRTAFANKEKQVELQALDN